MTDEALTEEQQAAVATLDRDVLVTASAGTGKTRVLTHRFTHIVEQGLAAADEILTLTFTEKAAREMKERIVKRFDDLGREEDRRRVETAYIGTIHSFCARALRENALEAGVDPHFTQLEPAEAAMLQRQVYDSLIRRKYSEACPFAEFTLSEVEGLRAGSELVERGGAVVELLSEFDLGTLRDILFSAYGYMRSLGKRPPELVIAAPADLDGRAQEARQALEAVLALPRSTKSTSKLLDALNAQRRDTACCAPTELLQAREFDWATYDQVCGLAGLLAGNVGSRDQKAVIGGAKGCVLAFAGALLAVGARAHAQALRELLAELDADYSAAKDEQGFLDFDDLLAKTRDLFGTPQAPTPTALRYRERFKFFLMDEFQDTNRLQMSVVAPIVRPGASFTVGDAKQSIYRFLYADVDVFLQRERELAAKGGASLPLSRNFRSHPDLLAFTNALFGAMWQEAGFPFEAATAAVRFGPREGPRVEVLLVERGETMRDARAREANALARRIGGITGLGASPPLLLTEAGNERPATFGDVLVLFRATSDIQLYEDALTQYDIPYYTVSGRGFYDTREVQDLRNLLAAVENPLDDVALAAVLRSPLVGISDEGLYWLGAPPVASERDEDALQPQAAGRIATRLEQLEELANLRPQDRERLTEFRKLFRSLRESTAGSRVADILEQAIHRTDYDLKLLCQRNGRRRYANVEKLRQIALSFQSKARFGLRDFLEHLEALKVLAERETEAAAEAEDSDVVRLMTVHQAKGLEAPIVVVADLGRALRHSPGPALLSAEGELALRLKHPVKDETAKPESYARLEQAAGADERAENQRLFYVACTRAKEHLLLSGCMEGRDDNESREGKEPPLDKPYAALDSWALWIRKFLGLGQTPAREGECVRVGDTTVLARSDGPPLEVDGRSRRPLIGRFRARLEAGEELDVKSPAGGAEVEDALRRAQEVAERLSAGATPAPALVCITVTGATHYAACPRAYQFADIEHLPPLDPARGGPEPVEGPEHDLRRDREDEPAARRDEDEPRDRGTRLHDVLSRIDFHADFEQEVQRLTGDLPEDARDDARDVLRRFRQAHFAKASWAKGRLPTVALAKAGLWDELAEAQSQPGGLYRETPFVMRLVRDGAVGLLRGKADALMRREGAWTIIDYKTGARHDDEYRRQVSLYALACRELLGAAPRRGIVYYLDQRAGEPDEFDIEDAMLEGAAANVETALTGIAAGHFPRREGDACRGCGYAGACRDRPDSA